MEASYQTRRDQLEEYFDRTAVDAWAKLTSDAPLRGIRATVRAGRERMRETLLSYLPTDLRGQRVLDAGCGTGALATILARRGATVLAIDLSPTLVQLARERSRDHLGAGQIEFRVRDMLAPDLGHFDWVVAMDSLIHYAPDQAAAMIARLAERTERGLGVTFAPRTPLLTVMHTVGRALPRGQRAPSIAPVAEARLRKLLAADPALVSFEVRRCQRVDSGFYISSALELVRR